jgi:CDP-diglyceride synthetase
MPSDLDPSFYYVRVGGEWGPENSDGRRPIGGASMTENVFGFLGRAIWRPIMVFSVGSFIWTAIPQSGVLLLIMVVASAMFIGDLLGTVIGETIGRTATAAVGGQR